MAKKNIAKATVRKRSYLKLIGIICWNFIWFEIMLVISMERKYTIKRVLLLQSLLNYFVTFFLYFWVFYFSRTFSYMFFKVRSWHEIVCRIWIFCECCIIDICQRLMEKKYSKGNKNKLLASTQYQIYVSVQINGDNHKC